MPDPGYYLNPSSSVDWLRQYLPTGIGDFLGRREQEALQPTSPREVAGDVLTTAMNVMPAGRFVAPRTGIKAYHGSPYDFDRFDLSKIGTGEGEQAYGHGLYFAENPATAQAYKEGVKNMALINANNARMTELAREMEKLQLPGQYRQYRDPRGYDLAAEYDRLMEEKMKPGKMYEVSINAKPEQFLDWDRPLSVQNSGLTEQLKTIVKPSDRMPSEWISSSPGAESRMRDAGIPGIRYLDQGSRGQGGGTSNYVLFRDDIVDILKKWGLVGAMGGAASYDPANPPAMVNNGN